MHYLIVVAWALLSLLAYIGYGYYPLRLAGVEPRWPFAGTIGIGFVIALGGVLNLMKGLTRPALIAIVICGAVLWLLAFRNHWGRIRGEVREFWRDIIGNRWKSAISVLLLTLLAASFFGNIITYRFKLQDDLVAYGDYAVQTAELGTLPANPFGERRIQSSLGSGYLLQAITLVVGDVRSLYVPDISLGFLLAVGAVYLIARRRLGRGVSLLLASLVFVLCFLLINASFYILPEALVLTLCWLGIDSPNDSARWLFRCALIGITAAALASLKSTYLPFSFFFCLFLFASYLFTFRRAYIALGGLICAGSAFAVLFPWMLDQHRKESTWLFPILGKGFDASAYPGLALPSGHAGLLAMRWTVWKYSLPFLTIWASHNCAPPGLAKVAPGGGVADISCPGWGCGTGHFCHHLRHGRRFHYSIYRAHSDSIHHCHGRNFLGLAAIATPLANTVALVHGHGGRSGMYLPLEWSNSSGNVAAVSGVCPSAKIAGKEPHRLLATSPNHG